MSLFNRHPADPEWHAYERIVWNASFSGYWPRYCPLQQCLYHAHFVPGYQLDFPDTLTLPPYIDRSFDTALVFPCLYEILDSLFPRLLATFARIKDNHILAMQGRCLGVAGMRDIVEHDKERIQQERARLGAIMLQLVDMARLVIGLYLTHFLDVQARLLPDKTGFCRAISAHLGQKGPASGNIYVNLVSFRKGLRKFLHDQTGLLPLPEYKTPMLDVWRGLPVWVQLTDAKEKIACPETETETGTAEGRMRQWAKALCMELDRVHRL